VAHAYRDGSGVHPGQTFATMGYDAAGRRIGEGSLTGAAPVGSYSFADYARRAAEAVKNAALRAKAAANVLMCLTCFGIDGSLDGPQDPRRPPKMEI
jgi:hypothetical protein